MHEEQDRNNLKILKYNQNESLKLSGAIDETNRRLSNRISESEALLKSLGYEPKAMKPVPDRQAPVRETRSVRKSYNEILADANQSLGQESDYGFEDILSSGEIAQAYRRVDEINEAFSRATRLNRTDLCFLVLATALQTVRWIFTPRIGESFDPNERMDHNDKSIKDEERASKNEFRDKHYSKDGNPDGDYWEPKDGEGRPKKSWIEILYSKVPYDRIKGGADLGLGLSGPTHRQKTFGHDPILGWVFGPANILTETISLTDLNNYRVVGDRISGETLTHPKLFGETIDASREDWHCLAAAIAAHGIHLKSDVYTKLGLPVPLLSLINEEWVQQLTKNHYDALCFQRDIKTIAKSALASIFINMIISFVHGLFYNPERHGDRRELYEVKTRKILLISNSLASTSNIIYCCLTKNPHKLDIGGLLVTLARLFMDIRFITRIKEEFIQGELDKDLNRALTELDELYGAI